jgi:TatD DNase family protein
MQTSEIAWIDTHCHLYAAEFGPDRKEMMERAINSGIKEMMLPNIDLESLGAMNELTEQYHGLCKPMIGLHPCSVGEDYRDVLRQLRQELQRGNYYGIGETGVDLYWETKYREIQVEAFEQQIVWAKEYGLPVIIHSRESLDMNIDIIKKHQDGTLKGIFHCFSGSPDQVKRIYELGFKTGIGGIVTYKNSGLSELLPVIPKEMIVVETDAPYLAPVPFRGKRNESSYLVHIAERIAQILDISMEDLSILTTDNARQVFTKKG